MNKIFAFLLATMIALPALAQAPKPAVKTPDAASYPVLEKLRGKAKNVSYDYLGQRLGTEAWLMSAPGLMQVVYTVPGQKTAIVGGALLNSEAEEQGSGLMKDFMIAHPARAQEIMVTVRAPEIQKQAAAENTAALPPSEKLWRQLAGTGQITFGSQGTEIYALVDPAAAETKAVWGYLGLAAKKDAILLHVVPLALTNGDSIMTIATMLGNPDPKQAWEDMIEGRPIANSDSPDAKGALGMKATVELAQSMNFRQLPLLIYCLKDAGGKLGPVKIVKGMPKDWPAFLQSINAPIAPKAPIETPPLTKN